MKTLFRKFRSIKKRKLIKRSVTTAVGAWHFRYATMIPPTNGFVSFNQTKLYEQVTNISKKDSINLNQANDNYKIKLIKKKSDLKNTQWIKEYVCKIQRGGSDEKLIKSIIAKVSETDWDIPSINKILQKIANVTLEIASDQKLLRILAELEKPIPELNLFVEGWVNPLPRHRKIAMIEKPKCSTLSIESLLDSTKCYGHREGYNMPRTVGESFETSAVKKLAKTSLKNPRLSKEYKAVKSKIEEGVHPVNLNKKSTYVSSTKVLVKKPEGRYLVDVSDTKANIVAIGNRSDAKSMIKFKTLTKKLYNVNLKGY